MKSDNLAILYTCHQKECMVKVVPHISLSFSLSFSLSLCGWSPIQSQTSYKYLPKGGWPTLFSGSNPWSFKWVSALWSVFWVVCVFLQQDCAYSHVGFFCVMWEFCCWLCLEVFVGGKREVKETHFSREGEMGCLRSREPKFCGKKFWPF